MGLTDWIVNGIYSFLFAKPPITDIFIEKVEDGDKSFCTIQFKMSGNAPQNFELRIRPDDPKNPPIKSTEAVLLTPCLQFLDEPDGRAIAHNLLDTLGSETDWHATYGGNIFDEKQSIRFRADNRSAVVKKSKFKFGVMIGHPTSMVIEYYYESRNIWKKCRGGRTKRVSAESPDHHRYQWVQEIYDVSGEAGNDPPKLHPKQQATIRGIELAKEDGFNADDSTITYVGLDDAANFVTSLSKLTDNAAKKSAMINLRRHAETDVSADLDWFARISQRYSVDFKPPVDHDVDWEKSDLIVDTYTAMFWGDGTNKTARSELKNRIYSLNENGHLVLSLPASKEAIGPVSPPFLTNPAAVELWLEKDAGKGDRKFRAELRPLSRKFSNVRTYLIRRIDSGSPDSGSSPDYLWIKNPRIIEWIRNVGNVRQGHENLRATDARIRDGLGSIDDVKLKLLLSYGEQTDFEVDVNNPDEVPGGIISIARTCLSSVSTEQGGVSAARQIFDFDSYSSAAASTDDYGGSAQFAEPVYLRAIEDLSNALDDPVMRGGAENILCIQGEPGWGKTSMLGAVLIPHFEKGGNRFFMATLEQAKRLRNTQLDENEKMVIIIDDLYKYWPDPSDQDHPSMIRELDEISSYENVRALIFTCQPKEMDDQIGKSPEWGKKITLFEIGQFSVKEDEYESFVTRIHHQCVVRSIGQNAYNSNSIDRAVDVNEEKDAMKDALFGTSDYHPRTVKEQLQRYLRKCEKFGHQTGGFAQYLNPISSEVAAFGGDSDEEE